MDIGATSINQLAMFWSVLEPLIIIGITAGVVLAVIFASIKIGWRLFG